MQSISVIELEGQKRGGLILSENPSLQYCIAKLEISDSRLMQIQSWHKCNNMHDSSSITCVQDPLFLLLP